MDTPLQDSYFPRFATLALPRRPRSRSRHAYMHRMREKYHAELSTLQHRFPNFFLSSSTLLHPFSSFHAFLWLCALPAVLSGIREHPFQRPARGEAKACKSRAPVKLIDWPETSSLSCAGRADVIGPKVNLGQKQRFAAIDQSRALEPETPNSNTRRPFERGRMMCRSR